MIYRLPPPHPHPPPPENHPPEENPLPPDPHDERGAVLLLTIAAFIVLNDDVCNGLPS